MIDCHVIFICEMFICEISSESTRDDLVSQSSASLERIRHVMWWYWCLIYTKQKIVSLLITRLCNMRGRHRERIKSWIGVCVRASVCVCCAYSSVYFLLGRQLCWLRSSRHWPSCWVGGSWCCPSQGSVTSGRRWCLLGWPPDSTDTHWTVWQVSDKAFHSLCHCVLLSSSVLLQHLCLSVHHHKCWIPHLFLM